jgi:cytochrome c2
MPAVPHHLRRVAALTGPNLWGIVGRARRRMAGFPYSEAMKSHRGELDLRER